MKRFAWLVLVLAAGCGLEDLNINHFVCSCCASDAPACYWASDAEEARVNALQSSECACSCVPIEDYGNDDVCGH